MTQAQAAVPMRAFTMGDSPGVQTNLLQNTTPLGEPNKDQQVARTIGCTMALTKTSAGPEAASTQAVNRGHSVELVEVPDEEDNTAF